MYWGRQAPTISSFRNWIPDRDQWISKGQCWGHRLEYPAQQSDNSTTLTGWLIIIPQDYRVWTLYCQQGLHSAFLTSNPRSALTSRSCSARKRRSSGMEAGRCSGVSKRKVERKLQHNTREMGKGMRTITGYNEKPAVAASINERERGLRWVSCDPQFTSEERSKWIFTADGSQNWESDAAPLSFISFLWRRLGKLCVCLFQKQME